MGPEDFDKEMTAMGLTGPIGEVKLDGAFYLIMRCAELNTNVRVPPTGSMNDAERLDTIEAVRMHLAAIRETRRKQR